MNESEKISVIIPCYNAARYLSQALESLLWQSYSHWECILIDDGSTDQSKEIYDTYASHDNRFQYIYQSNSGPSVARNKGIEIASGAYIQFLDADDIFPKNRFEECVGIFRNNPNCDVVYTEYMTYNKNSGFSRALPSKFPHDNVFKAMLLDHNRTFIATIHEFLFRKEIMVANKFDESLPIYCEDVECWIRIAESGATFIYLEKILAIYRFAGESLSSQEIKVHSAKLFILEKYLSHPEVKYFRREYDIACSYFKERLVIAYFMQKEFKVGWKKLIEQWGNSKMTGKLKMLGWFILMTIMKKETFALLRANIILFTPLRWGGWKQFSVWSPTNDIVELLEST
ncbi:MAG TPA: hypothetical protein DCQ28_08560 [Bacteroidetes bacterium]|nr:hypothetical protein [Bacteroidota bacterium]